MIRLANEADRPALLDLMEVFNRGEGIDMRREVTGPALSKLLGDPTLGRVLVLVENHAPAGYAIFTWGFDLEFGGRDAFLTEIYVTSGERRQGRGRALLDEVLRLSKLEGAGALHLGVLPGNEPALALYRAAGFTRIERHFYTKR